MASIQTDARKAANTNASPTAKNRAGRVAIAQSTLSAIESGIYPHPQTQLPIPIPPIGRTTFYPETTPIPLPPSSSAKFSTRFLILPQTTLAAATTLLSTLSRPGPDSQPSEFRVTLLNFASATKPGGGYLTGAQAQEESIARSSNLSASSLESTDGQPFYQLCKNPQDKRGGYYTDAVVYSEGFSVLKDDEGRWLIAPQIVDAVTAAAVNAGVVRRRAREGAKSGKLLENSEKKILDGEERVIQRRGKTMEKNQDRAKQLKKNYPVDEKLEKEIAEAMCRRMSRVLDVCLHHGARNLILGSFGTGVFQNNVEMVARTWMVLLGPTGKFKGRFENVAFGVLDDGAMELWKRIAKEVGIAV